MRRLKLFALTTTLVAASVIPAHADPISAVIVLVAADIGVTLSVVAVNMFLIGTAISIGLSLISGALNPTPKQQQAQQNIGISTTLQSGGTVPRSFIVGLYATGGSERYPARTWGQSGKTPNAYFTRFIALSDLPCDSLSSIIVDDKRCTYNPAATADANRGIPIPEYNLSGVDHLWVKFFDGTQTSADDFCVTQFGSDADYPYTVDMVGYGVAWVMVTALIEPTLFSSVPLYRFEVNGAKFYDPRLDSSAGGSGPQTWANPASWALTLNPVVVKYNILRGVSWNGQWLFGMQNMAAGRLPVDSWFAAMNVDDFATSYNGADTVAQFRCGAEISVDSAPADALDELNKCDNGRIAETGGVFKTRSGAVGSAVMSFTDADLLVTEAKNFDQFPGLADTINGIAATYPEPAQNWSMTAAPSLFDVTLEAADNSRRLIATLQYNYVPYSDQVQFLMKAARDEDRNFRKHTVIAGPQAFQLESLDVISWSSAENGYSNKLFTAVPIDQDNVDQGMVLTEVDPADYDWTPGTDRQDYTPVTVTGRAVPNQVMTGWAVSGDAKEGDDGREVAVIEFAWGITGIAGVDGVQYQVRLTSDSSLVLSGETDRWDLGGITVSQNILGNTAYQARGRYRPANSAQTSDWSSWLDVTTPNVLIGTSELQDALLTFGKFAAGLTPVQQVNSLSAAIPGLGNFAVLTTDKKLYRDATGTGGWTTSVDGADIIASSIVAGTLAVGAVSATNEIVNNLIVTGHLVANTATDDLNNSTGSIAFTYTQNQNTAATQSVTLVNNYSPIVVTAFGEFTISGSTSAFMQPAIYRDNVNLIPQIDGISTPGLGFLPDGTYSWVLVTIDGTAPAGRHSYEVFIEAFNQTGTTGYPYYNPVYGPCTLNSNNVSLTLLNFKR